MGDSVLVVGDEATIKVHVHTDDPEQAMAVFADAGKVTNLDVADMREQIAEREARLAGARTGIVAVVAGVGIERLYRELGAEVVVGGETLNPSTAELLAAIGATGTDEVVLLPNSANVIMAAERACELSDVPARVVHSTSQQAGLAAAVELDPEADAEQNVRRLEAALSTITTGGVAPAARADAQGRFQLGDAVGFINGEIFAWGGAGSTIAKTMREIGEGRELLTVLAGEGAPIPLSDVAAHAPEGVELELHEGGQPSWWWLLAAQ